MTWIEGLSPRPPLSDSKVFTVDWRERFWRERGIVTAGLTEKQILRHAFRVLVKHWKYTPGVGWWEYFMTLYKVFVKAGDAPAAAAATALKLVIDHMLAIPKMALPPITALEIITVGAIAAVTLVVVIYVFNPTRIYRIVRSYKSGRYVMRMQEILWWADVVGETPTGRSIYTICSPVGGFAEESQRYLARDGKTGPDTIYFHGTWRESWFDFPHWYQKQYESLEVDFVGLCWGLGGGLYVLRMAHEDEFSEGIEDMKEVTERSTCEEPEYEDSETILSWASI